MKITNVLILVFFLFSSTSFSQIKGLMMTEDQKAAKAAQEEAAKEKEAELAAYFGGRSETPGADVASDKANVPVKKENFESKLARYQSEGFKVAVVFNSGSVRTKEVAPSSTTSASSQLTLSGSLPSMKNDLMPLVEGFAATMNETFSTDVFEIVDLKNIPYKESKFGKVDDWATTKYKMVVTYSATPLYDYTLSGGKYAAKLTVNLSVVATEFVNEKKGVKMKYPIRAGNLGYYQSAEWESENEPGFKTIDELHTAVNPPSEADLLAELQKEQAANMDKFIEKRKK